MSVPPSFSAAPDNSAAAGRWPTNFTTWRCWVPVLLAIVVGLAFQGTRGLTETSETRYAECAREMLVTGNWLEPQLEFQPHWTKPPAAYWFMAAGMKVLGVNAWGARLPAVLALAVATAAVVAMGRRLWDARTACLAGTVFTLGFPLFGAYVATTDVYLMAAEALAVAAFVAAATAGDRGARRRLAAAMWAAWGLAFLIKGPPALLPLLALLPWNFLQPRERRVPLGHPLGLLCFAAVALPWYAAMLVRHPSLLHYYVGTEIVARVSSDLGHNRAWYKAIEIYAPTLLGACGVFGVWAAVVALTRGGWARLARWRELWRARDARLLLVAWVVLPMVVFCLSSSKLHLYVLPLAVPLALIVARVLAERVSWRAFRRVALGSAVAFVAAKGVAGYADLLEVKANQAGRFLASVGTAEPHPGKLAGWMQKAGRQLSNVALNRRDMAALGAEIRAALATAPAGTPIVLWDEATNHGVTFYLELGREALPERIASDEKAKFETWTVAEFAARVRAGGYPKGALLVVDARKRARLDAALPGLPVVAETSGRHWQLLQLAAAR